MASCGIIKYFISSHSTSGAMKCSVPKSKPLLCVLHKVIKLSSYVTCQHCLLNPCLAGGFWGWLRLAGAAWLAASSPAAYFQPNRLLFPNKPVLNAGHLRQVNSVTVLSWTYPRTDALSREQSTAKPWRLLFQ